SLKSSPSILSIKAAEHRLPLAPSPSPRSSENWEAAITGTSNMAKRGQVISSCCALLAEAGIKRNGRIPSVRRHAVPSTSGPASSTGMGRKRIFGLAISHSSLQERACALNDSSQLLARGSASCQANKRACLEECLPQGMHVL